MAARVTKFGVEVLRSSAISVGTPVSASTSINFTDAASEITPIRHVNALSVMVFTPATLGGGDCEVLAASGLILSANPRATNTSLYVSASNTVVLVDNGHIARAYILTAAAPILRFADIASAINSTGPTQKLVSATTTIQFAESAVNSGNRIYRVDALTTVNLPVRTTPLLYAHLLAGVASGFQLTATGSAQRIAYAGATTTLSFQPSARSTRDISALAITSMNLAENQGSNKFWTVGSTNSFGFNFVADASNGGTAVSNLFRFLDRADATVFLPIGGGVPGGTQSGLRTVLLPSISGEFPNSYAETPSGLILIANGIDPMQRWDGLTGLADTAGVIPSSRALELGGTGVGYITGQRAAYVRFLDEYGNVSSFSPVSNYVDFGTDGLIDRVGYNATTGVVTITATAHGRSTGDPIVIEGVQGIPLVNGQFTVNVIDVDTFTLTGVVVTGGTYTMGGRWIYGIASVVYGNVAVSTEPKVVRRQILRNLDGNSETFYVDIDTTDLTSTAFLSTSDDEALAQGASVPMSAFDETPFANRFGLPPSHKAIVVPHLGRIFAAGEVSYTKGNAQPVFGYPTINGVGTEWRASMVGRMIYLVGAKSAYEIAAVNEATQVITTVVVVTDATGPFTSYAIRPAPAERRFIYFSEPALPEAWPAWNAVSLSEDSDDVTGLMVKSSFLYILEQRHIYKLTFESTPSDARVWLTTRRGCINNRCHVQVEDTAYMLDEVGLHKFDGQTSEPISDPIQNIFQQMGDGDYQVNWNADRRYWHAAHDPVRDTIRWFIAMTGSLYPRHAICYDYRRDRFWIEEYPFAMTSSTVGTIGYRRSIAGSDARRILCLGEGSLDAIDAGNALRGNVTSAGPLSISDSSASFPLGLAGAPVSIASGKGVGQQRRISANTSDTLSVDRPWIIRPDVTSVYQIGGINWKWQSGWFEYVDDESDNNRDVEVVFQPNKTDSSTNIRLYFDHDTVPRNWTRTIDQDGVSYLEGQPEVTIDMTYRQGFGAHRYTGHKDAMAQGDTYVSVELSGVQASEIHRIYQINVNGAKA